MNWLLFVFYHYRAFSSSDDETFIRFSFSSFNLVEKNSQTTFHWFLNDKLKSNISLKWAIPRNRKSERRQQKSARANERETKRNKREIEWKTQQSPPFFSAKQNYDYFYILYKTHTHTHTKCLNLLSFVR